MMDKKEIVETAKDVFVPLFPVADVVPAYGKGCEIFDMDGRRYLDFAAGIAVNAFGHAHPGFIRAATEQLEKLHHTVPTFHTGPKVECAKLLLDNSCFDQVFFTNSGTEAVEAALKLGRKRAYDVKGPGHHEFIAFRKGFHGRSMGAASLTYKRDVQPYYQPYLDGIKFADFGDLESVKAVISEKTAAIIVEPVQGEGGVTPATVAFLQGLCALCDQYDAALIFDEIQCGMGRIGTLYAYEHFGVEPDMATLGKGLGNGFPIGALVAKKAYGDHFTAGSHGSTYGGNPLGTACAHWTVGEMLKPGFLQQVRESGALLREKLEGLKRDTNKIGDIRGLGLMVGFDTPFAVGDVRAALQERGLLVTQAGDVTVRLTPPLIAGAAEVEEAAKLIGAVLRDFES